jgi:hypothetical protein
VESCCEFGDEHSGSMKCWETLEYFKNWSSAQLPRVRHYFSACLAHVFLWQREFVNVQIFLATPVQA